MSDDHSNVMHFSLTTTDRLIQSKERDTNSIPNAPVITKNAINSATRFTQINAGPDPQLDIRLSLIHI